MPLSRPAGPFPFGYNARNETEEEWEEDRFIAAARACQSQPAMEMFRSVFRAADAFTGAAKQYDDMTLLIVKLAGVHAGILGAA